MSHIKTKTEGMDKITDSEITKVDKSLGLVFGWAIICKNKGEDYFDVQGDHIPEDAMLEATTDFAKSMVMGDMHTRDADNKPIQEGDVIFSMPVTAEIAKAFGVTTDKTGWMIAVKPHSEDILAKFESGVYTGFSIGGKRIETETVDG